MSAWGVRGLRVVRAGAVALEDIDLTAASGTIIAVVGGDGAGKTTLLQVLAGTLAADAGQVRRPRPERIGGQLGAAGVWDDLSVIENLELAATCYRVPPGTATARIADLLAVTGLESARRRLAGALSGGMRHKLGVCAALVHSPDLVLLDEPTTGIDPVSRAQVWRLIARTAAHGATVVMTTTHLDEAERAATVLVLDAGRALVAGAPMQLLADEPEADGLADLVVAAQLAGEQAVAP